MSVIKIANLFWQLQSNSIYQFVALKLPFDFLIIMRQIRLKSKIDIHHFNRQYVGYFDSYRVIQYFCSRKNQVLTTPYNVCKICLIFFSNKNILTVTG